MNIFKSLIKVLNHPLNKNQKKKTFFILTWWKINQIFFKIPAIIEIVPNRKCICYPQSSFGSLIVYTKRPEHMEMKLTELILNKDSIFLDVGSGIGDFSLIASNKITTGKIFAFEPSKEPLQTLKENIAINFLENKIKVIDQVASDRKGQITFEETSVSEVSHIGYSLKGIKKKTNTLDNIIKDNKLNNIDLIKIDVEGAESLVLKGLDDSLQKEKVKSMIIELNSNANSFNSSKIKLVKNLIRQNFKVYVINEESLSKFNHKLIKESETINIIAVHKSFKNKTLVSQYLT
jgi:FkbM family methyltransferase